MCDAKSELIQHVIEVHNTFKCNIKCAECFSMNTEDQLEIYRLPINYTDIDLDEFYNMFDFEYIDLVEFTSELVITGTIWWSDGSWSTRDICGDFESWVYYRVPPIPKILKSKTTDNILNLFQK